MTSSEIMARSDSYSPDDVGIMEAITTVPEQTIGGIEVDPSIFNRKKYLEARNNYQSPSEEQRRVIAEYFGASTVDGIDELESDRESVIAKIDQSPYMLPPSEFQELACHYKEIANQIKTLHGEMDGLRVEDVIDNKSFDYQAQFKKLNELYVEFGSLGDHFNPSSVSRLQKLVNKLYLIQRVLERKAQDAQDLIELGNYDGQSESVVETAHMERASANEVSSQSATEVISVLNSGGLKIASGAYALASALGADWRSL